MPRAGFGGHRGEKWRWGASWRPRGRLLSQAGRPGAGGHRTVPASWGTSTGTASLSPARGRARARLQGVNAVTAVESWSLWQGCVL